MKRALLLMLCTVLSILPASVKKENFTHSVSYEAGAGEIRMVEIGDVTSERGGVWAETKNGHLVISVDRISLYSRSVAFGVTADGGSVVASYDEIETTTGNLSQIKTSNGGFARLVGGDCSTETGFQGFYINEVGASSVGVQTGDISVKGKYGLIGFLEDSSSLTFSAKKIVNDGDYGVFLQCTGRGNGKETLVTLWADELETTGTALEFQQYGSGYYSNFVFGKVKAGDIALRLMVDRGNVADILVKEDITGRIGVKFYSDEQVKLIVLGTINASEAPILAVDISGRSGIGFNSDTQAILAWRIIPTESGHVVMAEGKEKDVAVESKATEPLEKAIRYIIRTEESDKAAFTLKKADGEDIRRSFGYSVACEGERVLVNVKAADGYRVTGVMNGEEKPVPLERDENGSWYFDMPRGGGISLFAVTEPAA